MTPQNAPGCIPQAPRERLDPIARALRNPRSLALAIRAKCWDCQGGDADPAPARRIRECEVTRCPLHHVRPYQRSGSGARDDGGEVEVEVEVTP